MYRRRAVVRQYSPTRMGARRRGAKARPWARHAGAAAILCGTLTTHVREASAESNTSAPVLTLDWSAPPECPDESWVHARVDRLVRGSRAAAPLRASGRMTPPHDGPLYRLELLVGDVAASASPRVMEGVDCARLAEAAALILALDIDPDIDVDAPPDESTQAGLEPPVTPPDRPPRAQSVVVAPKRRRIEDAARDFALDFGARVVLDHGSLPRTTLGLQALVGIARGPLSLDLGATIYRTRFVGGPHEGAGGADLSLATFTMRGCVRQRDTTLELRACAGGELGREETRGVAIALPISSAGVWGSVLGAVEGRAWPRRAISPMISVAVGHAFAPNIVIYGFGTVFDPPPVFVRAYIGLDLRIF